MQGLYGATQGYVSAPLGPLHRLIPVTFHGHPYWFCFGITLDIFGIALFGFLLWYDFSVMRRINKKYPMRNLW